MGEEWRWVLERTRHMADVSIISVTLVGPVSTEQPTKRIELTPREVQFLPIGPIQKGLLFLRPTPPPRENSIIDHLKTSLSRTLDLFYLLAGNLGTTVKYENTTYFFINCNGAGAQFLHAAADGVTVADMLETVYLPRIVHSFFPLNGVRNSEGVSPPLLGLQVIELVDGMFIGCTVNHSIAGGASF